MQLAQPSATFEAANQLVVHAQWSDHGLHVRFADGLNCHVPLAEALCGHLAAPDRIAISRRPPVGLLLFFGDDQESLPWDWLRGFGDAAHRALAAHNMVSTKAFIAQRLVAARKHAGLTQQQLATAAGIGRATLARLEAGQGGVTVATLQQIGTALGLAFTELF